MMNLSIEFSFEKETPGTYRFKENAEGPDVVVGTLYVKKSAMSDPPKTLTVTIQGA
jgi:hypothetical protein